MKFRVIGHRKDNAARVNLEFEAQSKMEAEREAIKQGLEVVRVEIVQGEGTYGVGQAAHEGQVPRRSGGGAGKFLFLLLILIAVAAAGYWFWPQIQAMLPK